LSGQLAGLAAGLGWQCHDEPMEHFSTERLIARDWTTADADSAFAIYGREGVARWLGAPPRRPAPSGAAGLIYKKPSPPQHTK
jgi:RimJ/RimL family protein N-acetyltransferase